MSARILVGDCRKVLRTLPDRSVHAVITSPPYFGLRDYETGEWEGGDPDCEHKGVGGRGSYAKADGKSIYRGESLIGGSNRAHVAGAPHRGGRSNECACGARRIDDQLGLEESPEEFVAALVEVFREVRRVLRDDGTVWLNLGDSYCGSPQGNHGKESTSALTNPDRQARVSEAAAQHRPNRRMRDWPGIKPKDLILIPARVALALQADGWWVRQEVVWSKPNPMPESVEDRPVRAHEAIYQLTKSDRYFYDFIAVRQTDRGKAAGNGFAGRQDHRISGDLAAGGTVEPWTPGGGRHLRDVWDVPEELISQFARWLEEQPPGSPADVWRITTKPYAGAHYAVFPPDLIEPCVKASSPKKACGACGAPWRRLYERIRHFESNAALAGTAPEDVGENGKWEGHENGGGPSVVRAGPVIEYRTLGFEPSCDCDAEVVPGVVLDICAGSGTVGIVCGWHGRDFIGIELSPENALLAEGRIAREGKPSRRRVEPVLVSTDQIALELG